MREFASRAGRIGYKSAVMGSVPPPHARLTVTEFVRLVEADAFGTTRVELLNGRIHFRTQDLRHMAAVSNAVAVFDRVVGTDEWCVFQGTLRLDRFSAPDPDLLWLPCPIGTPEHQWPQPILLIEISDTTYREDSGPKLRKYAYHGIPEYWIENLPADRIEVYRQPQNPTGRLRDCTYGWVQHFGRGQTIPVAARPGLVLSVDELLG